MLFAKAFALFFAPKEARSAGLSELAHAVATFLIEVVEGLLAFLDDLALALAGIRDPVLMTGTFSLSAVFAFTNLWNPC